MIELKSAFGVNLENHAGKPSYGEMQIQIGLTIHECLAFYRILKVVCGQAYYAKTKGKRPRTILVHRARS